MHTKRSLEEIYKEMENCESGREARKLHKELKEYGDGLQFKDRYPNFPLVISLFSLLLALMKIFLPYILRWL